MRQVPVPEGWSDIFSGHFEPFLRLSNRKISQRRPFRHGSFHLIFRRLGHGLGQNRKSAAQKLRRCATQNCRSATSRKAVDVGLVASSAKREQIAVQEIAPVGVVDLSVQEHVVITAQSALSHIERPLVAVKEKGVRSQFASIENHFLMGICKRNKQKT